MKSLIIYFSRTGENYMSDGIKNIDKGNTEIVADYIRNKTHADVFSITPEVEYPYDYYKCCDVAKEELNNDMRPKVKFKLDDISDYDVIYIGGPVWWGHFPCVMFTVLEGLNFKDKIVKVFTTHEGSGLGNVMEDIKRICVGAVIESGLSIYGSEAIASKDKIESWCI